MQITITVPLGVYFKHKKVRKLIFSKFTLRIHQNLLYLL